jgi:hypothetical protein
MKIMKKYSVGGVDMSEMSQKKAVLKKSGRLLKIQGREVSLSF